MHQKISQFLNNIGINTKFIDSFSNPSCIQYDFKLLNKIKDTNIAHLENELSIATDIYPVKIIIDEINSKIKVQIPNDKSTEVNLRKVLNNQNSLSLPVGVNVYGKSRFLNIPQESNVIIAGATNSGKSTFLHSVIISLINQLSPDELKLVLMDMKQIEMGVYQKLPHLMFPVIHNSDKAKEVLTQIIAEINKRKTNPNKHHPYIFILIDEFSDLMATDFDFFKSSIEYITENGSEVKVSIILCTSRPDPQDIIPLEMKDKFYNKISFATATADNSITIINHTGGEKLTGQGDMLFQRGEYKPERLHGFYISENEINNFIRKYDE